MEPVRSLSPPLPPDPQPTRKVQPFQEPFVLPAIPLPHIQPQEQRPGEAKQPYTSRARATSRPPPVLHQQVQPIKDAVNHAFDSSSVVQNELDPELVRKVTEEVIRSLQTANLAAGAQATPRESTQPQQTHFAPPPQQPLPPQSPTQSSIDSMPPRYTPPSPHKDREQREDGSHSSPSPERAPSDAGSAYSRDSRDSRRSEASVGSRETPRPMQESTRSLRRSNTNATRRKEAGSDEGRYGPERRDSGSDATTTTPFRPLRRPSRDSEMDYHDESMSRTRARPPRMPSDVAETTTLEKIWQPLFDNDNPTMRLSQFLRGLAHHLIEEYEPKGSLVVTPAKMLQFLNETKVPEEHYPWEVIFGGKAGQMTNASLSTMYRNMRCQHHLVQTQNHESPSVPGLTPHGFEWFLTCLIQAHPDTEFERLATAVMNMPISNADNKTERFPKELSRRLLPTQPKMGAEQRIVAALAHERYLVPLSGASLPPPPPPPPGSAPPQQTSFIERERKPYAQTPHSDAVDDEDLGQPSLPLERERKPYTAKEGAGKVHDDGERERERDRDRDREWERARDREPERSSSRPATSQYKPETPSVANSRPTRSNSGVPAQAVHNGNGSSDPMNIPPASGRPRMSTSQGVPPPSMNGSYPRGRRSSPPPKNTYARSEPFDLNGIPQSQYETNMYQDRFAGDPDDDTFRRYHSRRPAERSKVNGNSAEDDGAGGRGYPIPPRAPPSTQGYDSGYGSTGGPPVGSYPRQGFVAGSFPDRRSTWYGNPNLAPTGAAAGAGTDGYGSSAGNGNAYPPQPSYGSSAQH